MNNLAAYESHKEQADYEVESAKADEREDGVAVAHELAVAVPCVKEPVD